MRSGSGRDGEPETDDGEDVGVDPGLVQALADGFQTTLDIGAKASVEHEEILPDGGGDGER